VNAAPRHLCVVTETYPPEINGVALTLERLVRGLSAGGHAVSVVRPRQGEADRADAESTLVRGLPLPGYKEVRIGLPAGRALRARWTACRPDVVYVATEGPLGWSAARAARGLGIPAFSGFHTNFHVYARHYGAGWFQALALGYLRRFHNGTAGTLVASGELRDELRRRGFENLTVIGRGVDGQLFNPARRSRALRRGWGASDEDLVVLHVGRLAPEKNVPLAIQAYRAMQPTGARALVVVGDGPMRAALEAAHRDVRFCGMRTGEDLATHYASADAFLFPSESETFGNVTLEAMASGLALVAYDYAAARVHVRHGDSGMLAPLGASQAFVEHAVALAQSPDTVLRLRRRARAHALAVDWQRVVDRFESAVTRGLPAAVGPHAHVASLEASFSSKGGPEW
jgi:glycosyltransferase involved in cell wall biosynthesis